MAIYDTQPENRNFLSPLNFQFSIKKAPNVNFFLQKVNIPDIFLKSAISPNPLVNIPYPGDHITYGKLDITFKVDEDLENYLEVHNWIKSLGKPESFAQYKAIEQYPPYSELGIYSDIVIFVLNSAKKPIYEVVMKDAFPVSLSQIGFNTVETDVNYITASASFNYTYYDINQINA